MLTWDERRNWLIGILTAAVGGFLTGYNVGYVPWATEINPFSAFHVTGEWYAVAKILLAFVLFPLVGYTTRYLRDRPARYETAVVALLLLADAWGNIGFANYDALSVAHAVATPLLAATVVTTAVCVALVFTPELRRLTRRVWARVDNERSTKVAVPTLAVLALLTLSAGAGLSGVAAQDNTQPGDEIWNNTLSNTVDDIEYDTADREIFAIKSGGNVTVLNENGTEIRSFTTPISNTRGGRTTTDGDSLHITGFSPDEYYEVSAADGSVIRSNTNDGYTKVFSDGDNAITASQYFRINSTADPVWSVSGPTFSNGHLHSGSVWVIDDPDSRVYELRQTSPDSPQNTSFSDVEIQNFSVSIGADEIFVNDNGIYLRSSSDGAVAKYTESGTMEWQTGGLDQRTDEIVAKFDRVYVGDPASAYNDTDGNQTWTTSVSGSGYGVATNGTAAYFADSNTVRAFTSGATPTQQGITGNVYECPSADSDCTNNPFGPGVGPDALVQVRDTDDGTLIEEANTTASGEYTLQNITQDDIYNVEVYVGGEKRYDENMGLSPSQGVGRDATVPMEDPALSDFSPVDGATVGTANVTLSADLSDDDFPSDEVTVEWFDGGDNKIGEETVSADGTATTSWQINQSGNYAYYATATDKYNYTDIFVSQVRTFSVSPEAVSPWEIEPATASPSDNNFVDTSHTHSIDLSNLNESNVRVRFYDGSGAQIGADTVSGNGTKTASVAHSVGSSGNYAWYVVAEDLDTGVTRSSRTFSYRVPGGLNIYNKDTGDLIDDRTVTAEITTPGDLYELETTTGKINFSDLPTIPRGNFNADVVAAGYFDTSLTIFDAATRQNVYLTPEGDTAPNPEPSGDFDVAITGTNSPVTATETASVEVDVTNIINSDQEGTISLYVDGRIVDHQDIRLQDGETEDITLGWQTDSNDVGNPVPVTAESDTDSSSANFQISPAPTEDLNASVNIIGSNSPVQEGQTLNVNVNVTNNNTVTESGYIVGYINGSRAVTSNSVSVAPTSTETKTLSWMTDLNDSGSYNFVAASDVNNDTTDVTVTEDTAGVSTSERVDVLFTLTDRSGDFTPVSETTLRVQQRVNTGTNFSYQEVASGEFGAANAFQTTLTRNERYNLVVEKGDNVRDIGGFRTNVSGEFDLVVNARSYPLDEPRPWSWNTSYDEENNQIKFGYTDTANDTDVFEIDIYEYGNSSNYLFRKVVNQTLGTYEYSQVLTENESRSRWVVSFCATRNGEEVCREEVVGSGVDDIFGDAPDWLLEIFGALSILFVAGIFSTVNAKVGAIVTLSFAGLLYAVGVMSSALTGLAIAVALTIAVIYKAGDSSL